MAGRPRKPTAAHKRDGTFRADRHGDRCDEAASHGEPAMPVWLDAEARWAWQAITSAMAPGVLAAADTLTLAGVCSWWSHWRVADTRLRDDPADYKAAVAATMAWKNFSMLASKLGLTPTDRARLHAAPQTDATEDDKDRFFRVTG